MAQDATRDALAAHHAASRVLVRYWNVPRAVREEVAQEATLRTLVATGVADPRRYAARIAIRLAVDWIRRNKRFPRASADPVEETPWQSMVEARLDLERVGRALAEAPAAHRDTLVLLCVEGASLAEVVRQRVEADPALDPVLERDRWYKRRRRAHSWLRARLAA